MQKQIRVRKGVRTDLPSVFALINELAVYEKEPREVVVTLKDLERDGFGKNPIFKFFVAELNKQIVGMALFYIKYSTWKGKCVFLDDLVVSEAHRRQGVGKLLFEQVIDFARKMKARKLEWQVLDWNKPAIAFYKKYNTKFLNEWLNCKLTDADF